MKSLAPFLSIVTTVDAHDGICESFTQRLAHFSLHYKMQIELIFVDDLHALQTDLDIFAHELLTIKIITPNIHLGQFKATLLGLKATTGDIILIIDPDMSDNINNIPDFITKIHDNNHVVFGKRIQRLDVSLYRIWLSKFFNLIIRIVIGISIHDINTPMIMATRAALNKLNQLENSTAIHKFYLCREFKGQLSEVPIIIQHNKRSSNYNILKRLFALYPELFAAFKVLWHRLLIPRSK